jgi:hypothetical protein
MSFHTERVAVYTERINSEGGTVPANATLHQLENILHGLGGSSGENKGNAGTNHGDLRGRSADDHNQYFNTTRGDARFYKIPVAQPNPGVADGTLASATTVLNNVVTALRALGLVV